MNISEISMALTGLLTTVGGAIAFVWVKIEKRFSEIEKKLEACEKRERRNQRQLVLYEAALSIVMDELEKSKPASTALNHARHLLKRALSVLDDPTVPKGAENGDPVDLSAK
jgi:hypothetical protein